ncbi:MAG: hypothetical protein BGO24_06820 [Sphingomonas sp. 67-36]|nr:MAG: hypothetical protein BGO24_06820 [Sphingomonas sp. 67-36]
MRDAIIAVRRNRTGKPIGRFICKIGLIIVFARIMCGAHGKQNIGAAARIGYIIQCTVQICDGLAGVSFGNIDHGQTGMGATIAGVDSQCLHIGFSRRIGQASVLM